MIQMEHACAYVEDPHVRFPGFMPGVQQIASPVHHCHHGIIAKPGRHDEIAGQATA